MSYIEHGTRIFGMVNNVLTGKRSDGRLKEYDSCMDTRAWSSNELENSRYFRELTESTSSTTTKILQFSKVIDNLITLGTQTENELAHVRRELERYKALDLTLEQATQLRNAELLDEQSGPTHFCVHPIAESRHAFKFNVDRFDRATSPVRFIGGGNEIPLMYARNSEVGIQVCLTPIGYSIQDATDFDRSSTCDYTDGSNKDKRRVRIRSRSGGIDSSSNEASVSASETELSTRTSESMTDEERQELIIKTDANIIGLKCDLKAKDAELAEVREENKKMHSKIQDMATKMEFFRGNFLMSQEKLAGMGDQQSSELEDLKFQLEHCKGEMKTLQISLVEQKQEFRKLLQEEVTVRTERDALHKQVEEMKRLAKSVEPNGEVINALVKLKNAHREREELKKKNANLMKHLDDDERQISELIEVIDKMKKKSDQRQVNMEAELGRLRAEIAEKNTKINQCEEQLINSEKEISKIIVNLRNSLNCTTEFQQVCEEVRGSKNLNQDLYVETKMVLSDVSKLAREKAEYRVERASMIEEIQSLKRQLVDQSQSNPEFRMGGSGSIPDSCESCEINVTEYSSYDAQDFLEMSQAVEEMNNVVKFEDLQRFENQIDHAIEHIALIAQGRTQYKFDNKLLHEVCLSLKNFQTNIKHFRSLPQQLKMLNKAVTDVRDATQGLIWNQDDTDFQEYFKRFLDESSYSAVNICTDLSSGDVQNQLVQEINIKTIETEKLQSELEENKLSYEDKEENYRSICNNKIKDLKEALYDTEKSLKQKTDEMETLQRLLDDYKIKLKSSENDNLALQREIKSVTNDRNLIRQQCDESTEKIKQLSLRIDELYNAIYSIEALKKDIEDANKRSQTLLEDNGHLHELMESNRIEMEQSKKRIDQLSEDIGSKEDIIRKRDVDIAQMNEKYEQLTDENEKLSKSLEELKVTNEKLQMNLKVSCQELVNMEELAKLQEQISELEFEKMELTQRTEELKKDLEYSEASGKSLEEDLAKTLNANHTLKVLIERQQIANEALAAEVLKKTTSKDQLNDNIKNVFNNIASIKHKLAKTKANQLKSCAKMFNEDRDNEKLLCKYRMLQTEFDQQKEILRVKEIELQEMTKKWHSNMKLIKELTIKVQKMERDNKGPSSQNSSENLDINSHRRDLLYNNLKYELENQKTAEIQNLQDQIEILLNEKKDLLAKIREKENQYNMSLEEMKQKFDRSKQELHRQHTISVKRLEAHYNELAANDGSPAFDPNKWLLSLTEKEKKMWHSRFCPNNGDMTTCSRNNEQMGTDKYMREDLCEKPRNDKLFGKLHNEIFQYEEAGEGRGHGVRSNAMTRTDQYMGDTDKDVDDTLFDSSYERAFVNSLRSSSKENLRNKKKRTFLHECSMRYSIKCDEA